MKFVDARFATAMVLFVRTVASLNISVDAMEAPLCAKSVKERGLNKTGGRKRKNEFRFEVFPLAQ